MIRLSYLLKSLNLSFLLLFLINTVIHKFVTVFSAFGTLNAGLLCLFRAALLLVLHPEWKHIWYICFPVNLLLNLIHLLQGEKSIPATIPSSSTLQGLLIISLPFSQGLRLRIWMWKLHL